MISAVENEPRLSGMPGAYHLTHCTPSIITRAARTLYYYYHIVRQPDEGGHGDPQRNAPRFQTYKKPPSVGIPIDGGSIMRGITVRR